MHDSTTILTRLQAEIASLCECKNYLFINAERTSETIELRIKFVLRQQAIFYIFNFRLINLDIFINKTPSTRDHTSVLTDKQNIL